MAYDETLAARVREILEELGPIEDRRMFGGLTFMRKGRMCCGVLRSDLVLKLSPERADQAARDDANVRPMDFTGRPMPGMVYVNSDGVRDGADLRQWVTEAANFVDTRPAEQPRSISRKKRRSE